jgi:hypothetical protein
MSAIGSTSTSASANHIMNCCSDRYRDATVLRFQRPVRSGEVLLDQPVRTSWPGSGRSRHCSGVGVVRPER